MEIKDGEEVYIISYAWYEDYVPKIVVGPKHCNWDDYCKSLTDEGAERAMKKANDETYGKEFVGVMEVMEGVLELLKEVGYRELKPTESQFFGSCIIKGNDEAPGCSERVRAKIVAHNAIAEALP